jgi:hypothetical protein
MIDWPPMTNIISITLLIAGVIHLLPITGVLGVSQLNELYGIAIEDANLTILMRHRAVLFALLGAFLVFSAFTPSLQKLAITAGLISTISFLALALTSPDYNTSIARVVYADIVAIICLIVAGSMRILMASE